MGFIKHGDMSISPSALRVAVEDLQTTSPWRGVMKVFIGLVGPWLILPWLFSIENYFYFILAGVPLSFWYASVFILTHDAIHYTLTGWKWFDDWGARLIAYPFLWPHRIYQELHRIHHKMNGSDPEDPERPHWTEEEYLAAGPAKKWYVRHQWWIDCFVFGGFGFIGKHYREAWKYRAKYPRLQRAIYFDTGAIILTHIVLNAVALHFGKWTYWAVYFLLVERVVGMVHQMRSHIEHYGMWGAQDSPIEIQIFASRNIRTSFLGRLYFNGLNFHSVHHAFPRIPFYNLREAHRRMEEVCKSFGRPMEEDRGYLKTALRLALKPVVVGANGKPIAI